MFTLLLDVIGILATAVVVGLLTLRALGVLGNRPTRRAVIVHPLGAAEPGPSPETRQTRVPALV